MLILPNNYLVDEVMVRINRVTADKSTTQSLNIMELAREDGGKLISSKIAPKTLNVEGVIFATSKAEKEAKLDEIMQSAVTDAGTLVIDYAGGYRLFNVSYANNIIGKINDNDCYCTFDIEYKVLEPPFGLECNSTGTITLTEAYAVNGLIADTNLATISFLGTAEPKPSIKLTINAIGDITSLDLINQTTGQQISIDGGMNTGDVVVIDTDYQRVTLNGEEIDYTGVILDFVQGNNILLTNIYSSTGNILEASQTVNNGSKPVFGTRKLAQSFKFSGNGALSQLALVLSKTGNPTGDVTIKIETDNTDSPSGTAVANGEITIAKEDVITSPLWLLKIFEQLPQLTGTVKYWLVVSTAGTDAENFYSWHLNTAGGYADGSALRFVSYWSDELDGDFCFKVYKTLLDQSNINETAETVSETFDATTKRDNTASTDNWAGGLTQIPKRAVINQQQQDTNMSLSITYATKYISYQSFVPDASGVLSKVRFKCKNSVAGQGGYLYILNDNAGVPGTTLIQMTKTIPNTADPEWFEYDFSATNFPAVVSGTKYWIGIISPTSGTMTILANSAENYASGKAGYKATFGGTFTDEPTAKDWVFEVYVNPDVALESFVGNASVSASASRPDATRAWTDPGKAVVIGDGYARIADSPAGLPDYLVFSGFDFAIPTDKILTGLQVTCHISNNNPTGTNTVEISFDGGTNWTTLALNGGTGGYDIAPVTTGSRVALPTAITPAMLNSANLRIRCVLNQNFGGGNGPTGSAIDHLLLTAYSFPYNYLTGAISQSIELDAGQSVIASVALSKTATEPAGTSIDYEVSGDGTNFETIGTSELSLVNLGASLKFKATLNSNGVNTPSINDLTLNYKTACVISATTHRIAQSFVAGFSGSLGRINLDIKKVGAPGDLVVKVYSDDAGSPDTELGTATVSEAEFSGAGFSFSTINLDTPADVISASDFWIVVSAVDVDSSNYYLLRTRAGDIFPTGALKYSTNSGGAYTAYTNESLLFQTFKGAGDIHNVDMAVNYVKRYL